METIPGFSELSVTITGFRPLILHNGQLADPLNEYAVAIKKITDNKKYKKTPAGIEEMSRLEWEGGWYVGESGLPAMPSTNLERMIVDGARKASKGKDATAGVLVKEDEVLIEHELLKGVEDIRPLWKDKAFSIRTGVKVTTSRVMRVRPQIPTGWTMSFTVQIDEQLLTKEAVREAIREAGARVGLGDWRPKFGRFAATFH